MLDATCARFTILPSAPAMDFSKMQNGNSLSAKHREQKALACNQRRLNHHVSHSMRNRDKGTILTKE